MKPIDSAIVIVLHNGDQETERELTSPADALRVALMMLARNASAGDVSSRSISWSPLCSTMTIVLSISFMPSGMVSLRAPHSIRLKISAEVVAFVVALKAARPQLTTSQCLEEIETRFGIKVHRRSLGRALARKKERINLAWPTLLPPKQLTHTDSRPLQSPPRRLSWLRA